MGWGGVRLSGGCEGGKGSAIAFEEDIEDEDDAEDGVKPWIGRAVMSAIPSACAAAVGEGDDDVEPDRKSMSSSS